VSPEIAAAPEMGQHTEDVLLSIGLTWDDLAALKESGTIS
jgi:crotonobetainyl-CoA:carnitine CoA-transferase CaiB-like acyl-CoA transferase